MLPLLVFLLAVQAQGQASSTVSPDANASPDGVRGRSAGASTAILDRHGRVLRTVLSDRDLLAAPAALEAVSPWAILATLAAEDRRFFSHGGVDLQAVLRALWQNAQAGRTVSGGSTLTQQLVRCLEPRPRTFIGKVREGIQAVFLERRLDKAAILESYLNRAPYGHRTQGIAAASSVYFDVPARDLSLAQAAMLAGIPKSPARYDPLRRPELARKRQLLILKRMKAWGWLDDETFRWAEAERVRALEGNPARLAPHFTERVRSQEPGASALTTLDGPLQERLEPLLASHLRELAPNNVTNGALVVLDNATGDVLAWVGSADFLDKERQGEVDGVVALRQPGSALKPFSYGLALSRGMKPSDILEDMPTFAAGGFTPKNYDETYHGRVRVREALACSYNVPAVRIAEKIGIRPILATLHAFGFDSLKEPAEHYGLGLVLGNGEVTLLELANAYATLARGGVWKPVRLVLAPQAPTQLPMAPGDARLSPGPQARRALDRESTYLITDILSDNAARAEAFGLNSPLVLPFPFAAKTGTTKDYRDNWAVGFTPDWTVAVWVGNFDGKPMRRVSGITGAAPVLHDAAMTLFERFGARPFSPPIGIQTVEICPESGELPGPWCPDRMEERFPKRNLPARVCSLHRAPEKAVPPASTASIEFPKPGDVFKLDPSVPRQSQVLLLRANGESARRKYTWRVDQQELSSTSDGSAWWPLNPGRHMASLTIQDGARVLRTKSVRFLVLP